MFSEYINFVHGLAKMTYEGLDNVAHPVLIGFSLMQIILAVLLFKVCLWVISVLTGGKQDKEIGNGLDNNNNYIYRSKK